MYSHYWDNVVIYKCKEELTKELKMVYKGYEIEDCTYSMVSVFYCGDDVLFDTIDEAKRFIDEIAG